MFSQNIVILRLVASGGGRRSLFTMEVSALEDNYLEVDDDDLIDNVLYNLTDEIVDLTSTTSTTAAQQPHFRDDPLIPIYSSGKDRSFSSKNVAEEIMNGVSTHLISSLVPHQPNENIAFMIGTHLHSTWAIGRTSYRTISVLGRMMARKLCTTQHRIKLPEK